MKKRLVFGSFAHILIVMSMLTVFQASGSTDDRGSQFVDNRRWTFVDENGVEIDSYCVAPLYGRAYVRPIFLISENRSDGKNYLTMPVLVRNGDGGFYGNWKKAIEHSSIKLRHDLLMHEWVMPSKLLILKEGRSPILVDFYQMDHKTDLILQRGDSNAAIDLLTSDHVNQYEIRSLYGDPYMPIVYSYTKEEKELLRTCYKK